MNDAAYLRSHRCHDVPFLLKRWHAVAKAIQDELLFRVEVIAVEPGTLPRHEMKAKRLIFVQT